MKPRQQINFFSSSFSQNYTSSLLKLKEANLLCYIINMKTKLFLANLLFWIHFITVTIWFGLFLVPSSVWHDKIIFHFYLTILIVGHQLLWGLILMPWTHKFRMVCVLTTPMQLLRGQKISDPKNYDQTWLKEVIGKQGVKIPHTFSTIITFSAVILVTLQFFFSR